MMHLTHHRLHQTYILKEGLSVPINYVSWEASVQHLRAQPDQQALVEACYYDDPLLDAARRVADKILDTSKFSAALAMQLLLLLIGSNEGCAVRSAKMR